MKSDAKATGSDGNKTLLSAASALTSMAEPETEGSESPRSTVPAADTVKSNGDNADEGGASEIRVDDDVPMTFPQRLMEVLSNPANADIISWLDNGRGFVFRNKKIFALDVMPKYFKHSKFTSFTRKLNRWGFTRITRGPETGAYYHEFFQKDKLRLCMQMSCHSAKSGPESPSSEKAILPGNNFGFEAMSFNSHNEVMPNFGGSPFASAQGNPNFLAQAQQQQQQQPVSNTAILRLQQLQQQQAELIMQQRQLSASQSYFNQPNQQLHNQSMMPDEQQHLLRMQLLHQQQQQQQRMPQLESSFSSGQGMNSQNMLQHSNNNFPSATANSSSSASPMLSDQSAMMNATMNNYLRNNSSAYTTMLMAQEKAQAQMNMNQSNGAQIPSQSDVMRQQNMILQAQQRQLDLFSQRRISDPQGSTAPQDGKIDPQEQFSAVAPMKSPPNSNRASAA